MHNKRFVYEHILIVSTININMHVIRVIFTRTIIHNLYTRRMHKYKKNLCNLMRVYTNVQVLRLFFYICLRMRGWKFFKIEGDGIWFYLSFCLLQLLRTCILKYDILTNLTTVLATRLFVISGHYAVIIY